jgi:hypothetical protein
VRIQKQQRTTIDIIIERVEKYYVDIFTKDVSNETYKILGYNLETDNDLIWLKNKGIKRYRLYLRISKFDSRL